MSDANDIASRRRKARNTALALAVVAVAFYLGFIFVQGLRA